MQDRVLEELRENVLLLNLMSTSHARLIQLLGSQMDKVLNERYKDPKKRLMCGKCSKMCRMAGNNSSRGVTEEVGEHDLIHHLTQDIFKLESVKLSEPRKIIGESPTMSAISTETTVGCPTLTGGSIKFGEVTEHPSNSQEDRVFYREVHVLLADSESNEAGSSEVTPGTDAQVQTAAPGTEGWKDGETA
uniref:Integrase core domain containing protein n=1 Tax=Solanum tuberosum TaxID=4113 RepID=M1DCW4_SOLTU